MISSEELIRRVLAELQRRFRLAGRGTVGRVEAEIGLGAGYFKDQRRPGRQRFDLKVLFKALDALGVAPAEFFASVLGSADPVAAFKATAALLRRARSAPRILVLEAARGRHGGPGRGRLDPEEVAAELEVLDGLRHEDPGLTMRRVGGLMERVADSQVPLLLGVYASASRVAGRHDEAQMVLARALDLAEERRDHDACGDLLLRAADVAGVRGEIETAQVLAEKANLTFARSGNLVGIGRSLADQGKWLVSLGRPRRALRALRSALDYLPADAVGARSGVPDGEPRSGVPDRRVQRRWFSCLMCLASLHRRQGELEAAERYLERAYRHRRWVGKSFVGRLRWLQGSIAGQAGRHQEAEDRLREAFEVLQPVVPLDAALCGVELARVQLERARVPEAHDTVKALLPLLEPLEKGSAAAAALAELRRHALAEPRQQGLSPALLRRAARQLEKERQAAGGSGCWP